MKKKNSCPDCGSAPTNHLFAKLSAWFNHHRMKKYSVVEKIRRFFGDYCAPHTDMFADFFIHLAVLTRLGRFLREPDEKTSGRAGFLWEKAGPRGIEMKEFRLF